MSGAAIVALIIIVVALLLGISSPFAFFAAIIVMALVGGYDAVELISYGYMSAGTVVLIAIPLMIFITVILKNNGVVVMDRVPKPLRLSVEKVGLLIPPGFAMLLYAFAGGLSIAACFLAVIIPIAILMLLLMIVNKFIIAKETKLQAQEEVTDVAEAEVKVKKSAIPVMLIPVIIIVFACFGIMTLAETAAVVAIYGVIICWFFYKTLDKDMLKCCAIEAGTRAGAVILTLFAVMVFARIMAMEGFSQSIGMEMMSMSDSRAVVLLLVNLVLIVMGVLMDETSSVLFAAAIISPAVIMVGVNPVHFAAITGIALGMGHVLISKPNKSNIKLVAFAWLPTLLITTYIPQISLFLPILFGQI